MEDSVDRSPKRYRELIEAELTLGFKVLPRHVFSQFRRTLPLTRSEKEWGWLWEAVRGEVAFYGNLMETKKKVAAAKTVFKKTGRWPDGFDPDVDYVAEASKREGYPDWKP
jgi:hypothetical protein